MMYPQRDHDLQVWNVDRSSDFFSEVISEESSVGIGPTKKIVHQDDGDIFAGP